MRSWILAGPLLALLPTSGMAALANGGAALAAAQPGAGAGAAMIRNNQAAADYPTAASGYATQEGGLNQAVAANQAPGSDRLAMDNEPDKLVTTSGEVRLKLLIGHQLYSTNGHPLGQIKGVLLARGAEPQMLVDVRGHLVAVPWSKLRFGLPGALLHGRAVLPGGTEQQLGELPAYDLASASG